MLVNGPLRRIRNLLDHPMFGTVTIPPGACVDPSRFPEDAFPIHCPECGYALQHLPEPRCPECGQPFDRGRLLVLQYAERPTKMRVTDRQQRRLLLLAVTAILVFVLNYGGLYLLSLQFHSTNNPVWRSMVGVQTALDRMLLYTRVMIVVQFLALVALVWAVLRVSLEFRRKAAQRREVIAAIEAANGQQPTAGGSGHG